MKKDDFLYNSEFCKILKKYQNDYLRELRILNRSKYTISSYNNSINQFINFLSSYERELNFFNIKKLDMINFLEFKNITLEKQHELPFSSKRTLLTHTKLFLHLLKIMRMNYVILGIYLIYILKYLKNNLKVFQKMSKLKF